ncbi:hemolysin family protein [Asticcacaulis sp. 201]|uniref:hemolysin family protein n=1 Tax=Asticcacaulis sp. 201 TaxID=3028787 RepID=UPI0029167E25|nr:hemolysin family protein [Asticcacaulis sp. 201]MDV6331430.1 hemolysin family protein [Asticcacaulis sp. 201]
MAEPDDSSKKSFFAFLGFKTKAQEKAEQEAAELEDSPGASNLIDHARAFQRLSVYDVMTPRVDIVAIELSSTLADVVRICVESEHSRLPIYRDGLDDPVGVVHIKDILKLLAPEPGRAAPNWAEPVLHRLRRELLYVPSSMTAADLMLRMQAQRIHMALVIDEFGGTDGLVTLEDLVEAVVGDIDDEYDEAADEDMRELPNGQYEIDGRVELITLEEKLGLKLYPEDTEEEIDTLAGLVAVLAGRVPQRGEVVPYPQAGFDIEVLDADARRIKRLRLHRRVRETADLTAADD